MLLKQDFLDVSRTYYVRYISKSLSVYSRSFEKQFSEAVV